MTFKERAVAALEEHLKGTKGVVKATILDCLTIVKQVRNWIPTHSPARVRNARCNWD